MTTPDPVVADAGPVVVPNDPRPPLPDTWAVQILARSQGWMGWVLNDLYSQAPRAEAEKSAERVSAGRPYRLIRIPGEAAR